MYLILKVVKKYCLTGLVLLPIILMADQTIEFIPTYDNLVVYEANDESKANIVYAESNNGIGNNFHYSDSNFWHYASLLWFDLSSLSGKTVKSASLILYPTTLAAPVTDAYNATYYELRAIADFWNPLTVTYNSRPDYYTGYYEPFNVPLSTVPVILDVFLPVNYWVNGDYPNYGFYMTDGLNEYHSCNCLYATFFGSLEGDINKIPKLVVTVEGNSMRSIVPTVISPLLLD